MMCYRIPLFIGILILWHTVLFGQVNSISGVVVRQDNGTPIPFVNIWITGTPHGTSTNYDGDFEIKIPWFIDPAQYTLSFSSIGYYSKTIPLDQLGLDARVQLESSVTNLNELVILTEKKKKKNQAVARKLVQKAINQIPKNYPKKPYLLNTFYRHYCSENQNYVRLIEAAVDVYSPKNNFKLEQIPDQRLSFKVTQLRRSFDFTENARLFHPSISLNYLWSNDITDFEYHNPLAAALNHFYFEISDTTNYGQNKVIVINFKQKTDNPLASQSQYHGTLFVTEKDLAFIRTEVVETKIQNGGNDNVYSEISKKSFYKPYQDKYFLDRLTNDVNVLYASIDSNRVIIDTLRHRSHIEMIANNILSSDQHAFKGKEPNKLDLRKIRYDSTFWNGYTVLKATALEQQIIADLSSKISLQQQFQSFNTIDGGGISITQSDRFKDLLASYQGTPLYLVLWSNWGQLNHLDLKPVNYFKRMLKKQRVRFLLVAVEHNQAEWIDNRKYYGLNQKFIEHERMDLGFNSDIAKSYLNNVFPYFLSVSPDGTIYRDPPLPNNDSIKPFIKALIKEQLVAVPIAKE
jgi:hypothetical protein